MIERSEDFKKDYNERVNPALMTQLITDAVPITKDIGFEFLKVEKGYCKTLLPLNSKSSNQHGTHQALLLGLAGDYTGGLALATLIPHELILGVHEITPDNGMSLWLIKSEMEYLKPSTDDVSVEAIIPVEMSEQLTKRYHDGRTILLDVVISFRNAKMQDVAKGKFRYYCKKKNSLTKVSKDAPINAMFEHTLKTSAKLIAQLRAEEGQKKNGLFIDEISMRVAGKQGKVIADRFMPMLPELQNMVAARTTHLDRSLYKYSNSIKNVVFVGVGLDFRIYNNNYINDNMLVYELDLKEMISERKELEREMGFENKIKNKPIKIDCNFLNDSIIEKLAESGYDPTLPTFFIFEGCSMYFTETENKKILGEIANLLNQNNESVLWMDSVSDKILDKKLNPESVLSFLSNMSKLGEPFIYGFDRKFSLLEKINLKVSETNSTTDIIPDEISEVYNIYHFNLISCNKF